MSWIINVSNPSSYIRSDYVEVNLQQLGVPSELDCKNLKLSMLVNGKKEEIAYQIDSVLGNDSPVRILTFISKDTPPCVEDYSCCSAQFELEEGIPANYSIYNQSIGIDHYYTHPDILLNDAEDGFNKIWTAGRDMSGVKIRNGKLEFYISLVAHPKANTAIDYSGAISAP